MCESPHIKAFWFNSKVWKCFLRINWICRWRISDKENETWTWHTAEDDKMHISLYWVNKSFCVRLNVTIFMFNHIWYYKCDCDIIKCLKMEFPLWFIISIWNIVYQSVSFLGKMNLIRHFRLLLVRRHIYSKHYTHIYEVFILDCVNLAGTQ